MYPISSDSPKSPMKGIDVDRLFSESEIAEFCLAHGYSYSIVNNEFVIE